MNSYNALSYLDLTELDGIIKEPTNTNCPIQNLLGFDTTEQLKEEREQQLIKWRNRPKENKERQEKKKKKLNKKHNNRRRNRK